MCKSIHNTRKDDFDRWDKIEEDEANDTIRVNKRMPSKLDFSESALFS